MSDMKIDKDKFVVLFAVRMILNLMLNHRLNTDE